MKIAMCRSVPNFLIYVFAKYYLNYITFGKVITKIKSEPFTKTQCITPHSRVVKKSHL